MRPHPSRIAATNFASAKFCVRRDCRFRSFSPSRYPAANLSGPLGDLVANPLSRLVNNLVSKLVSNLVFNLPANLVLDLVLDLVLQLVSNLLFEPARSIPAVCPLGRMRPILRIHRTPQGFCRRLFFHAC